MKYICQIYFIYTFFLEVQTRYTSNVLFFWEVHIKYTWSILKVYLISTRGPWQVAQILSNLIFCNMLLRQNSWYAETKIFTKILQYTRSDLSLRRVVVTCCCNLLPSVYQPLRLTSLPGSMFPTLCEQQFGFLFVPQEYLLHVQWNPVNTGTKGIINNYSSSLNGLLTQSPWGREE